MWLNWIWIPCLLLAACTRDPIDAPGTWKLPPTGLNSNDENLRAMIVNPRDLVVGSGESTSEGVVAARAARRELTGRRAPLLSSNTSLPSQGGGDSQQGQTGQSGGGTGTGTAASANSE